MNDPRALKLADELANVDGVSGLVRAIQYKIEVQFAETDSPFVHLGLEAAIKAVTEASRLKDTAAIQSSLQQISADLDLFIDQVETLEYQFAGSDPIDQQVLIDFLYSKFGNPILEIAWIGQNMLQNPNVNIANYFMHLKECLALDVTHAISFAAELIDICIEQKFYDLLLVMLEKDPLNFDIWSALKFLVLNFKSSNRQYLIQLINNLDQVPGSFAKYAVVRLFLNFYYTQEIDIQSQLWRDIVKSVFNFLVISIQLGDADELIAERFGEILDTLGRSDRFNLESEMKRTFEFIHTDKVVVNKEMRLRFERIYHLANGEQYRKAEEVREREIEDEEIDSDDDLHG